MNRPILALSKLLVFLAGIAVAALLSVAPLVYLSLGVDRRLAAAASHRDDVVEGERRKNSERVRATDAGLDAIRREIADLTASIEKGLEGLQESVRGGFEDTGVRQRETSTELSGLAGRLDRIERTLSEPRAAAPIESPAVPPDSSPAPPATAGEPAQARVEAQVEAAEGHLIVLAAGSNDGVVEGQEFEIHRGGIRIARAHITRVFPDYSAARLVAEEGGPAVSPGDQAVSRLK